MLNELSMQYWAYLSMTINNAKICRRDIGS